MKYRVFTKKGCGTCRSVVSILREKQVEFSEIDVSTEAGLTLAQQLGITHSGAVIDENDKVIPIEELSKTIQENRKKEAELV